MKFESRQHKMAYNRISGMMSEIFGDTDLITSEDRPHWQISGDSAMVNVSILTWRDDIHLVHFAAYVAQGTEITAPCMRYLLEENHTLVFGGFDIDSDGDIAFTHSIIAETCVVNELKTIVLAIRETAEDYDDIIVERWGGKRAKD